VINDKAQTGVVLAGLPRLKYKLENLRAGRQQLTSRAGVLPGGNRMTRQDATKILNGVWRGLPKETVDAFAKTANGSARTLAKLISSVNKIMALNGIKTPDAEAAVAADGVLVLDADAVVRNNWTGVTVNGGTLEMNAGALVTASSGSGVRMERSGGVFTMNGGEIRGNTARDSGGGVYAESPSNTFNMTGGVITHNTAGTDGGGAFLSGTFFRGNPQIGGITAPPDGRGWIYDNYPNDMVNVQ
jgi:hypothetical protein